MKISNFTCKLISIFIFCTIAIFYSNSQEQLPQPGLTSKINNLSSFPRSEVKDLEDWKANNLIENYTHPEFGLLPDNAPCENCIEVLDKRTIDERYFVSISDNKQFFKQKALGDLHQLVDGKWQTIRHELHPVSATRYESGYFLDQPVVDFSAKRTELKTTHGSLHFNNWKLIVNVAGVDSNPILADWSDYTVGADGAFIRNVFPGIDAEMVIQRGAIKTSFIMRSNEFGVFDELIFREELGGLPSVHAMFETGSHQQGKGNLKLMDGATELAMMQEAKLFVKDGPKALGKSGVYSIHDNIIDLHVGFDWINANIGMYQLIIDPLVTGTATLAQASITGSRYNASCNFTNSCDYNLVVASPANATITNVTFSFTYSANGTTCWLQDGGYRIGTGSCTSPATAGFYWFCNTIGGGTCAANNQTIFSDIASCLPAPSCTPQNVNFTLRFYRSCWGATGCSNTCIGSASPWIMNIIGQTLEYTNTASNTTVSATTVCQGGSITASTSSSFGVPGYTYNWSFSPTGSPSVGTGASATITFPTAGTVTLYSFVTDACGNVVTSNRTITVTASPVVTATPNSATICNGQTTGIALSSTIANSTYTWTVVQSGVTGASNGTQTGNAVSINQTLSLTGTVSGTATYTITPSAGGCTGTPITVVVTVSPSLTPSVSVTASASSVCAGASVTFTATPTNGGSAPTYQWFVNGNPVAGQTASTFTSTTLTNGANVTVQMTASANPCLSTTTATSSPVVITVNPSITAAVSIASSASSICQGSAVTFTATPTNGGSAPTYQWFVNGNPVAGQTASTFTSSTLANGASVTVQMTSNATPCVAGSPATSNAINMTVNPVLVPAVSVVASNTTSCAGTAITFTATPTNGGSAPTYQWFVNGNPVAGQTASTFTSSSLTNGASITVQMTSNATPCLSPASATSSPVVVNVNPVIVASVAISASATTICAGDPITFTAIPTNGGSAPTYQWYENGNPVAGQTASTFTSSTLANGTSITVQMTSNATPCLTGSPATSNAITVTVNPILNPTVTITASSSTICNGTQVTFTANPTNGGSTPTYLWLINGNAVPGQTAATFSSNSLSNGDVVTVELTSNATPCLSNATVISNGITIVVNPDIVASVSISASATTICAGSSITFTATPTNGGSAPVYQWFVNGNAISGQTTANFVTSSLTNGASVTVQMTSNAAPCLVGSPATSNAIVIVVNPIPTVTASNNGPLCVTEQLNLSATTIAGAIYSWTGPQSFASASQNPSIASTSLSNAGTYTVSVNLNGCTSTASTSVVISTGTAATINPVGPFCVNSGIVTLTASAGNGVWSGPGITNVSTGTFNPALATIGANTISYTTPGACGGTSTTTIVVLPIPTVSIAANVTSGCSPLQVTFTDNSVPASSTVLWDFGNGVASSTSSSAIYTSSGCYDVTLTSTNAGGCSNVQTFDDIVCVLEDPIADFFTSNYSTSMYDPTFQFINQSENAVTYSWDFGNETYSSLVNPSVTYAENPTSYSVQLVAYNAAGCTDTVTKIVSVTDELIFFVPNSFTPNGDEFNNSFNPVFTSGFDPYEFSFVIFNRWGEIVFESKDATVGWDGTYNGSIVQEGVYAWTVRMKAIQSDKKYTFNGHLNVLK